MIFGAKIHMRNFEMISYTVINTIQLAIQSSRIIKIAEQCENWEDQIKLICSKRLVWSNVSGSRKSKMILKFLLTMKIAPLLIIFNCLVDYWFSCLSVAFLLQGQPKKISPSAPAPWIAGPKPVTWNWSGFLTAVGKRPSWMMAALAAAKRTLMMRTYSKIQIYVFMHASTFAMIMVVIILPISSISIYFSW